MLRYKLKFLIYKISEVILDIKDRLSYSTCKSRFLKGILSCGLGITQCLGPE